ncbi:hypothetical protein ADIMK_2439 [Marinobacterium lacunae]|uniref:Uncharacterized protein n=1 Tax=Marinobacterium lacunae TaxID=1232683 RepID=A0A081FXZ7_9GAMM|nr:hypothetical protein ADIMK_2439 [Marinobacterium lacunae]
MERLIFTAIIAVFIKNFKPMCETYENAGHEAGVFVILL